MILKKNLSKFKISYQSFSICHWILNSITTHNNDENLKIPGYNLYREDHPLNTKRGGVRIYYNISLPPKIENIHYLQECINFEIQIEDKLCNFITLNRSPNQCQDEFELFINNFE